MKRLCKYLLSLLLLAGCIGISAQSTLPDIVCAGQTKEYWVDPNPVPGSSYTWTINGIVQQGHSGNKFSYRWDIPGTFTLGLRETSADGCKGELRTCLVTVHPSPAEGLKFQLSDFNNYNISCNGLSDGYIHLSGINNTEGIKYHWMGPGGFTSDSGDIFSLKAGKYILTLKDTNLCAITDTVELSEPDRLTFRSSVSVSSDGMYNLNCAGDNNATIDLSASGYVKTISYLWSDGFEGSSRSGLGAGTRGVIATDLNNCNADTLITIREPDSIKIIFNTRLPECYEEPDGAISLNVSGGISGSNYSFRWSDNSVNQDLSGLTSGKYIVTVTDRNGCSVTDSVLLENRNESCLKIPNAFSPNGDLINDTWEIANIGSYPDAEVKVFNNWGDMVWKSAKGYTVPWDGTSDGKHLPVDSYYYVIDLKNGSRMLAGSVTIIK